jgi:formate hydrogenlyase subunit 4
MKYVSFACIFLSLENCKFALQGVMMLAHAAAQQLILAVLCSLLPESASSFRPHHVMHVDF